MGLDNENKNLAYVSQTSHLSHLIKFLSSRFLNRRNPKLEIKCDPKLKKTCSLKATYLTFHSLKQEGKGQMVKYQNRPQHMEA